MAKEKEPQAHQLYKQVLGSSFIHGESVLGSATNGWEAVNDAEFVFRSYIDLSGWSEQELTTFTQGVDIQKSIIPLKGIGAFDSIWEFDFITTRALTNTELTGFFVFGNFPGYLPSTVDLMEVIYAERMQYGINGTIPNTFVQIGGETFGSGNPTAMDKLHWTRYYFMGYGGGGDTLTVFPTNLIVQALTVEEKDLVWMERLRRSYVLQGGAD